ncbi:MAG: glycosyltransferase [Deltaproteobacteria bacterium]|nr:glycosyltransferase [Deltaproteobacteria bacterium]
MRVTIEVAIPCLNEARTIGKVVRDFRHVLPEARIVVYDNCSTDGTGDVARAAGVEVRKVNRAGKGSVVQAIFEHSRVVRLICPSAAGSRRPGTAPSASSTAWATAS